MGFRFRRSVRLLPGIRLNFGLRGISTSVGGKGFTLNFSKRGVRSTVGIPGTGISYSEMLTRNAEAPVQEPAAAAAGSSFGWGTVVFIVVAVVVLTRIAGGSKSDGEADAGEAVAVDVPAAVPPPRLPTAVVTARSLKCRAAPSAKAPVVVGLTRNAAVEIRKEQAGWALVSVGGGCWVSRRFLADSMAIPGGNHVR
jgi:Protein of unknown function (DUF4236)/Bacterial SH3 domain